MFKFESCFQCLAPGDEAAAASSHHDIDSGGSPMSHRSNSAYSSSAFGRESGFQSYCSINSINSALPLDDLQSQCSSSMSLMSAGQFDRNDALKRRSFCSSRDSSSSRLGFGGLNQGFSSRMSYARRSSYIPQTKFREMTAINEQQRKRDKKTQLKMGALNRYFSCQNKERLSHMEN